MAVSLVDPRPDPSTWVDIDPGALSPAALQYYLRRKGAVLEHLSGASDLELRSRFGYAKHTIVEMIRERCLQPHPDGDLFGWRGIVRYGRVRPYHRQTPVKVDAYGKGAVGALGLLLSLEPDLAKRFEHRILKAAKPDRLSELRRPRHADWSWFLAELRKLGYEVRNQWPFTVKTMGYAATARHIDQVLAANPARAALLQGGPDAKKKLLTGDGVDRPQLKLFQRVEMDAHKLDCRVCVMLPQLDGGWLPKIVHRLWVIVILEVVTRCVLGYFLSLGREVNANDVLRTIKVALTRWTPPPLLFAGEKVAPGGGLPSAYSEAYVGLCWDETSVDGALAETCKTVTAALSTLVASSLVAPSNSFSARRSKDDRPYIERFFDVISGRGVGRLSSSTGSTPKGKRGRDPERAAVLGQFQLPYLEELLAVLIANYNATPHRGIGYCSPLCMLDFLVGLHGLPRNADPALVQGLLSVRKSCVVKGGYREGRRPYVNFEGARYSNEMLAQRHDLVGQSIWVVSHLEDDARVALASTAEGFSLGVLRAAPPWHRLPHTLAVRSSINSMVHQRMFTLSNGTDAVTALIEYCESQPASKLPVHPTYLSVQRLLAEHAVIEQRDASDLQEAKKRLTQRSQLEAAETLVSVKEGGAQRTRGRTSIPLAREIKAPHSPVAEDSKPGAAPRPLPVLRMSANSSE